VTTLFAGLWRRHVVEMRRYGFDTLFQTAGVFLLFTLIFYGARSLGGPSVQHGDALASIVIGFVVLMLVVLSYASLATWVTMQATQGVLEQLAMSRFGLLNVLLAEYTAGMGVNLLMMGVMMLAAEAISGQWLHIDVLTLVPLTILLSLQVLGVGLLLAGAALVFKRIVSMMNLIQFAFLALIAAPVARVAWTKLLPISLVYDLIRRSTVDGASLRDFAASDLGLAVGTAAFYLLLGILAFRWMDRASRRRGLVGVY
jgi:ABC-2 type transport system permease protein